MWNWLRFRKTTNFARNSAFRSRSLVIKCMGRHAVFQALLRAFSSIWRLWKVAKLALVTSRHLWQLWSKGLSLLTKIAKIGDVGPFKARARAKQIPGFWTSLAILKSPKFGLFGGDRLAGPKIAAFEKPRFSAR